MTTLKDGLTGRLPQRHPSIALSRVRAALKHFTSVKHATIVTRNQNPVALLLPIPRSFRASKENWESTYRILQGKLEQSYESLAKLIHVESKE